MNLTAEELGTFLETRKDRVLMIVDPANADRALLDIRERIWKRLPEVPDEKSLDSLVEVEAVDFALRPFYSEYCSDRPDGAAVEQLFEWQGGFVLAQIRKTIRVHLASRNAPEIEAVVADVMGVMWERRQKFERAHGPFVPWARGIALNRARSYRPAAWREVSIDTDAERPLDAPAADPTPEESAAAAEQAVKFDGPPPESFVEILRLVQESEPHEAIAFLFNRYLDMKPAQIARENGDLPLPDALARVTGFVRTRYPEIAGIDGFLASLADRVSGLTKTFGQYAAADGALQKEIGRWVAKVQRDVGQTILQLGKRFLRCVCGLSAAVHEIVCFLWIRLLFEAPVGLQRKAHLPLRALLEMFNQSYAQRELLSLSQVEWCASPLRERVTDDRSLSDLGRADLYGSILRWCEHICSLIAQAACAKNILGYAYLLGTLRKGKYS